MRAVIFLLLITLAVAPLPAQVVHVPLPFDQTGVLNGFEYNISVPANWNGTLLVYAHGYGEGQSPALLAPASADLNSLLTQGFALAAARFDGAVPMPVLGLGGWQVKDGMQNTAALTATFRDTVGHPLRTIVWGNSMGAVATLGLIEKFPGLYDGAIALCSPGAGTPRRFDQNLDIALAYATVFGWNPQWGTPGNLRDDLDIVTEVLPHIMAQMTPGKKPLWEFIRRVNRIPLDSYYPPRNDRLMTLYFAFAVRAEYERRAGGTMVDNMTRVYTLEPNDRAALIAMGVDADAYLAQMNAKENKFAADRNARNNAEHYYNPTGRINRPVLTMHTTGDPLATPNSESAYFNTVKDQGHTDLLVQQFTNGNGTANAHCTFSAAQESAALGAMMYWLDTGTAPDASFFPTALGFVPNYDAGDWAW
jgi:pimeloyl-ACP methyl ester carboxylesterase